MSAKKTVYLPVEYDPVVYPDGINLSEATTDPEDLLEDDGAVEVDEYAFVRRVRIERQPSVKITTIK